MGYFFLFAFFVVYACIRYKWRSFLIPDLFVGFILLLFQTYFHYGDTDRGLILIFMANLFLYILVFVSSLFIYFDNDNEKRTYFVFTILVYLLVIIIEKQYVNYKESFGGMYVPIALSFFPLYFLTYYKKYIK
ncbi:hypothetical protein HYN56_03140 [Flavobacterium crocinum]|uniref:Uncharacterized protein n=1 Tax=Flavobacterium crocinum TaxID=2183896 RepID=A0A2S1YGT0_9FLAO|nr:hypothetical protein HYN56_03140 [Flavobacterium crocinum]